MQKLGFEDEIINYLNLHGNTKESDLIEFCTFNLHVTTKAAKKKLDKMIKDGWLGNIIHTELKTPAVYVTFKEPALYDLNQLWTRSLNPKKSDKEELRLQALRILEEAKKVAENRIKESSPRPRYGKA